MARAIWSGAVSFGLVNVPIRLYSATSSKDVSFRELQEGTGKRIRHRRVAEGTDDEVDYEDVVKGYEVGEDRYVTLTQEELEAAEPERSRTIEIEDFVDLADIDPIYFQKTYYLGPQEGAEKPYALLRRAMEETAKVGIARFVFRTKEHLAAIRPIDGLLGVETMFFADEIRGADEVGGAPVKEDVTDRELQMARQLIESMASDWEPERYRDTHRGRLLDLIERKAEGEEVVVPEGEGEPAEVVDLMAALQRSVEAARGGRPSGDELERRSKEELYEEAQRRKIAGRSQMSKEQLVDALRKAS